MSRSQTHGISVDVETEVSKFMSHESMSKFCKLSPICTIMDVTAALKLSTNVHENQFHSDEKRMNLLKMIFQHPCPQGLCYRGGLKSHHIIQRHITTSFVTPEHILQFFCIYIHYQLAEIAFHHLCSGIKWKISVSKVLKRFQISVILFHWRTESPNWEM